MATLETTQTVVRSTVFPIPGSRWAWALSAVIIAYLFQISTPLRLDHDAIVYLSMAASAADGHGFLDHGIETHYPAAYPALVVGLERIGAARSWGFVGLNALFLLIGLAAAGYIASSYFQLSEDWSIKTLLFTALSFAVVKFFTIPQTDIVFFGISTLIIGILVKAEREPGAKFYWLWAAAALLSIAAVVVRTIGIGLVPSLLWSVGQRVGVGNLYRQLERRFLIATGAAASSLAVTATLVLWLIIPRLPSTSYIREAIRIFSAHGFAGSVLSLLLWKVHDIGELALNAPASKLGPLAPLVWLFGILAIAAVVGSLRRWKLGVVEIYVAAYAFIMILWPYGDPRFWIPVLPFTIAELFSWLQPWTFVAWKRRLSIAYGALYVLLGIAGLGYSTRITISGQRFPYRSGTDNYENLLATYEFFYYGERTAGAGINEHALELLQRYSGKSQRVQPQTAR